MKKIIFILFLFTPMILFSWGGSTVRGLSGGETISKVKSIEKSVLIDEELDENYSILLYEDEIFSLPCSVLYYFYDGELDSIQLYFGPRYLGKLDKKQLTERVKDSVDGSNIFLNYMRYKYGYENSGDYRPDDSYDFYTYFWSFDDVRIKMVCEKKYPNYLNIKINYYFRDKLAPPNADKNKF